MVLIQQVTILLRWRHFVAQDLSMSRSAPSGAALHSSSANTLDSLVSEKGKLAQMGRFSEN